MNHEMILGKHNITVPNLFFFSKCKQYWLSKHDEFETQIVCSLKGWILPALHVIFMQFPSVKIEFCYDSIWYNGLINTRIFELHFHPGMYVIFMDD